MTETAKSSRRTGLLTPALLLALLYCCPAMFACNKPSTEAIGKCKALLEELETAEKRLTAALGGDVLDSSTTATLELVKKKTQEYKQLQCDQVLSQ